MTNAPAAQPLHTARTHAWPLVLAGTALVLALAVIAGFGMASGAPTVSQPTVAASAGPASGG
jgi:hypothetical protein